MPIYNPIDVTNITGSSLTINGNITVTGSVDGVDISATIIGSNPLLTSSSPTFAAATINSAAEGGAIFYMHGYDNQLTMQKTDDGRDVSFMQKNVAGTALLDIRNGNIVTVGSLTVSGSVSGSSLLISSIKNGTLVLTATSGSTPHGLSGTPKWVFLTNSGSTSSNTYLGSLGWYPSGSTGIWILQTGSGTVAVNWRAEI